MIARLVADLETAGVQLWEDAGQVRFRAPKGVMTDERRALLREHKEALLDYLRAGSLPAVVADPASRHEPFPLTDVQAAYLLGRSDAFAYGGVSCHAYAELAFPALDPARIERAWQVLVARHDMLRAVIGSDGSQRILSDVPPYRIAVDDARGADARVIVERTRDAMSHRMHAPEQWPLFELRVTLAEPSPLLHVSIDFLIADYVSIHRLFHELYRLYADPHAPLRALEISYRDYLLAERRVRSGPRYERDRRYWWERIDALPPAPELPLLPRTGNAMPVRFRRHELSLPRDAWASLHRRAGAHGVTASTALLAAYAAVIARWSRHPRFTLDITLLNRMPLHPDVAHLVGDFTSVSLLETELRPGAAFAESAHALQRRLWEDLDHRLCSGVEVMRELARRRGRDAALMPVVFTSAIGLAGDAAAADLAALGELVHGISQTPQVWIDCQVMERGGTLALNWDVRDGVFPAGVPEAMFGAFARLVRELAETDAAWSAADPVPLPDDQHARRIAVNATAMPLPEGRLHDAIVAQAHASPEAIAVISGERAMTYAELFARASAVSIELRDDGVTRGELVAISIEKGWQQIVAVLGTMLAGAAYLPLDPHQPPLRRDAILADSGARIVLTRAHVDRIAPSFESPEEPGTRDDERAYVIYTSGSTGTPKGVTIPHRAALNTIADINRRFGVTCDDRVLGVASLGFDLSVWDIFGVLGAGGTLVLPDAQRRGDPSHWAALIATHGITIWNSVPAQLQMLHDYVETNRAIALPSLRLAMLSGDWIPVPLPDAIRARLPQIEVVSLGGATEASIWSIVHPIGEVDPSWRSIPYGRPLANQTVHVLDDALRPCPDWTTGELYIGGAGLADGYHGDPAKTAERFIVHPSTGERLYRPGDLGRWLPDGNIEFLGREDFQVKIRGHRIELGEIEAAIRSHPAVARATVIAAGERGSDRRIAAFVETARSERPPLPDLKPFAGERGADVLRDVDREVYLSYTRALDDVALLAIRDVLASEPEIAPRHERLVRRWRRALEEHPPVGRDSFEEAWARVDELRERVGAEGSLVDYFRESTSHLRELLRGDTAALDLLFPRGAFDVTDMLYSGALFNRWANRAAAGALRGIARHADRPLRVLEAGAGAGGTTAALLEALEGVEVDYLCTDVSRFFLNEARRRFAAVPSMRFAKFDLNGDARAQGLLPSSFDAIVAGDVLHALRDVPRALATLHELLAPGGWLVALEMTRDHYQIMTSLELLRPAEQESDRLFRGRDEWQRLLEEAGGEVALALPDGDPFLSELGMHVFAARFKADRMRLDAAALREHLARRLPDAMMPAQLQFIDALPLTANGKVDHATLHAWVPRIATHSAPESNEAANELELRVAAVWASVLGVEHIGRDRDFFLLGGDSLLAAQLAARLMAEVPEAAELFFDDLLRQILEGPTVAALAARLATSQVAAEPSAATESPLSVLGGAGDVTHVLLHASHALAAHVDTLATTGRVVAIDGDCTNGNTAQVAARYARLLREDGAGPYHLIGRGAAARLAVEVARDLADAGSDVAGVTVVEDACIDEPLHDPAAYAGDITLVVPDGADASLRAEAERYWTRVCLGDLHITGSLPR